MTLRRVLVAARLRRGRRGRAALAYARAVDPRTRVELQGRALRAALGGYSVLLDGRPVCPTGGEPYVFRDRVEADRMARICYPGLSASVRLTRSLDVVPPAVRPSRPCRSTSRS